MSKVYLKGLNDFAHKFILRGGYQPTHEDKILYPSRFENLKASIFESLMLFDATYFKVVGENIPLAILINEIGVDGIERLIDQEGLNFVHWTSMIGNMVSNIPGVIPLVSGVFNSEVHTDPEHSIVTGLKVLKNQPNKRQRQTIIRKARDLYIAPPVANSQDSTLFATSAFQSNKLKSFGLDKDLLDLHTLSPANKKILTECAEDLLEYKYLISDGLTSLESTKFLNLFDDTAEKINKTNSLEVAAKISELEGFPDLKVVFQHLDSPLKKAISLRDKRNVKKFRNWLDEVSATDREDISKAYIDAIADAKGFFETKGGKFTKSVTMTVIGAGIGATAGPLGIAIGATAGTIANSLVEPALSLGLDLVDDYLISGLTKGWTPRMFFGELKKSGLRIEPFVS